MDVRGMKAFICTHKAIVMGAINIISDEIVQEYCEEGVKAMLLMNCQVLHLWLSLFYPK
jgi:hypothetical protein